MKGDLEKEIKEKGCVVVAVDMRHGELAKMEAMLDKHSEHVGYQKLKTTFMDEVPSLTQLLIYSKTTVIEKIKSKDFLDAMKKHKQKCEKK